MTNPLKAGMPVLPPAGAEGEPTAPAKPSRETAALAFLDPTALSRAYTLRHPFVLDDKEVRSVTVRRLSLGEVADIVSSGAFHLFDFYAAMTGLPVAVIRGLEGDDGEALLSVCDPFLPRVAVTAFSAPTSASGVATPSSPAAP